MVDFASFTEPENLANTLKEGVIAKGANALFANHNAKARALETVGLA
jgi:hypothetical protein